MKFLRPRFFKRCLILCLYLSYLACVFVFISGFLPANKYLAFSLLHLLTPVCLVYLVAVFFALAIFRRWWQLVVPALLLVVNIGNWSAFFQISKESLVEAASFDVLSFNVGFFDIPSVYSKEYFDSASAIRGDQIMEWIAQRGASVVCIQEFFTDGESDHHNYLDKLSAIGYQTNMLAIPNPKNKTLRGIVTCSRFPIVDQGKIFISSSRYNGASYSDLLVNNDTVRVINVHLESMELYFSNKKGVIGKMKHFWTHYKDAMIVRCRQVRELADFVSKSPYPVVIAGDFNETPYSYNHKVLRKQLSNAFESSGVGLGTTFSPGVMPVRIDHQYFSRQLSCGDFEVSREVKLSNHYPIYARYGLID